MHLAIDCRSVHKHMGGIGRAALELVRALANDSRGHRVSMIVGEGHNCVLPQEVESVTVDAAMIDERFEQLHLPSLLHAIGADLYLNTTFAVPAIKTTAHQLSIIHDVVFEDRPEYVEPKLRSYLSRASRFAASHADHILTDSNHARERIQAVYQVDPSQVTRVHLGISESCFETPDEHEVARIQAKYNLEKPFLLYLGAVEIKKGILELLSGYRQALDLGLDATLVLAGGRGGPALDLEDEIRSVGCVGHVRSLGFIDEADKRGLMKAANVFVYPSLYEGFGLPPLEAMAIGVPCVVSDQTSLPEVVGSAAMVARVQAAGEFGKALLTAAQDDAFRRAVVVAGPARARQFTWKDSASQVLDVCERIERN